MLMTTITLHPSTPPPLHSPVSVLAAKAARKAAEKAAKEAAKEARGGIPDPTFTDSENEEGNSSDSDLEWRHGWEDDLPDEETVQQVGGVVCALDECSRWSFYFSRRGDLIRFFFFFATFFSFPGFFFFLFLYFILGHCTAKRRTGHQPRTKRRPLVHSARNGTHRDRGFWEFYRHCVAKRTGTFLFVFCSFFVRFLFVFVVASVTDISTTILVFRW